MKFSSLEFTVELAAVTTVAAFNIVYVTDLPANSALAPCAQAALSSAVQALTDNDCPAPATALESSASTKDQNSASISTVCVLSFPISGGFLEFWDTMFAIEDMIAPFNS